MKKSTRFDECRREGDLGLRKRNKVHDEIADAEIKDEWMKEPPMKKTSDSTGNTSWRHQSECATSSTHMTLIIITTLDEYRIVVKKVMKVIGEDNNVERERGQTARMKRSDESEPRIQIA